ncbi:MAG: amino acid--tRNA ligase-related protein, partial [Pseudomonadota bacterium]
VFRNKERSSTHHPEFTMLEWYRAGAGYLDLVDDIHGLLMATASAMHQGPMMRSGDITCDATAIPDVITVADAFGRFADIDLLEAMDDALAPDPRLLIDRSEAIGLPCAQDDTWEDVFFRIFLDRIEPHLGAGRPTVLTDYPASMAALARIKPDEPRLCERFELYICGVELANAFGELTDPAEQRRRFEADLAAREARYGDRLPIDEDFLAALEQGMPEAAGIALGFDRLVMLAAGADQIEDVLWAPVF